MTTPSVFTLSQLISTAVAAYGINLIKGDVDLKASLTTGFANFTSTQADQFVKKYELVDQLQNVAFNGFSATVFLDKNRGKYVIAMRGTEMNSRNGIGTDLLRTDLASISGNGFANVQAVEMYRYFKRLTTIGGQTVQYTEAEKWRIFAMANSLLVPLSPFVPNQRGQHRIIFKLFLSTP